MCSGFCRDVCSVDVILVMCVLVAMVRTHWPPKHIVRKTERELFVEMVCLFFFGWVSGQAMGINSFLLSL
jgi:hypothetical protein